MAHGFLVPTAVRVEAGWDRSGPRAAFVNLFGAGDVALDGATANHAAVIAAQHRVSVADAHLGAVVQQLPASDRPTVVITSDPADMSRVADGAPVTIVGLWADCAPHDPPGSPKPPEVTTPADPDPEHHAPLSVDLAVRAPRRA